MIIIRINSDLALVMYILDAHKGEVKVRNNEAHEATVTLFFPNYSKSIK
jgi:hypothetical protein